MPDALVQNLVILLIGSLGGLVVALVQRRRHARAHAELKRQYEITLAERVPVAEACDTLLQVRGCEPQLIAAKLAIPNQPDVAAATLVRSAPNGGVATRGSRASLEDA